MLEKGRNAAPWSETPRAILRPARKVCVIAWKQGNPCVTPAEAAGPRQLDEGGNSR